MAARFRMQPSIGTGPYLPGLIVGAREADFHFSVEVAFVIHRGVQFTVVATAEPDVWEWRYELGDQVKSGRTQTRLAALAARRVKSKIDAALRVGRPDAAHSDTASDRPPMPAVSSGR
jgi:hypothetical protein